jgi:RNA polymerase sporulation-specific sigma factor
MNRKENMEQESDEELIIRLRDGETNITDFIINKYKNLVRKKANSMFILGADKDDLIQEGMIGLFKAIRDYDSGRDASFYTFADLCIARQIYTAIQAAGRLKHTPLNSYVSMSHEDIDIKKQGSNNRVDNPEELMIAKEDQDRFEKIIYEELSEFERQVFGLFRTGMTYSEIAKVLGKDEKSTDNAMQRIKNKMKKMKILIAFNS